MGGLTLRHIMARPAKTPTFPTPSTQPKIRTGAGDVAYVGNAAC